MSVQTYNVLSLHNIRTYTYSFSLHIKHEHDIVHVCIYMYMYIIQEHIMCMCYFVHEVVIPYTLKLNEDMYIYVVQVWNYIHV